MGWRAISTTATDSVSLSSVSAGAERLFWRMLAGSDTYGRLPAEPIKLRGRCMPLMRPSDAQLERWLCELEQAGRVRRYEADAVLVAELINFERWQPAEFLRRRGKPEFPPSPESVRSESGVLPATEAEAEAEAEALKSVSEKSSSSERAATDDDDFFASLNPSKSQRQRWGKAQLEAPERFAACLRAAVQPGVAKPAAYLDELVKSGQHPQPNGDAEALSAEERQREHLRTMGLL